MVISNHTVLFCIPVDILYNLQKKDSKLITKVEITEFIFKKSQTF